MVDTSKVIGFYTDVFGNEIDEYEQVEKYTVHYNAQLFMDDEDGWNTFSTDSWDKAIELYHVYGEDVEMYIADNEYDLVFKDGEWY